MKYIDISDAQKDLPLLLDEIAVSHKQVMITRDGIEMARVLPVKGAKPGIGKYPLRGLPIQIAEDFDEPLPELWEAMNE